MPYGWTPILFTNVWQLWRPSGHPRLWLMVVTWRCADILEVLGFADQGN